MKMTKKKQYKAGWLEIACEQGYYVAIEKKLTPLMEKWGGKFVGVVKYKKDFLFYYYSPTLLHQPYPDENFWTIPNRLDSRLDMNDYFIHTTYIKKPWHLLSTKEKEEQQSLVGKVLTSQDNEDQECLYGEAIYPLSLTSKSNEPPIYKCLRVYIRKWAKKAPIFKFGKANVPFAELQNYEENDLSFLVRYGAPRQIILNEVKKRQTYAQNQLDNYNQLLKQVEE